MVLIQKKRSLFPHHDRTQVLRVGVIAPNWKPPARWSREWVFVPCWSHVTDKDSAGNRMEPQRLTAAWRNPRNVTLSETGQTGRGTHGMAPFMEKLSTAIRGDGNRFRGCLWPGVGAGPVEMSVLECPPAGLWCGCGARWTHLFNCVREGVRFCGT